MHHCLYFQNFICEHIGSVQAPDDSFEVKNYQKIMSYDLTSTIKLSFQSEGSLEHSED